MKRKPDSNITIAQISLKQAISVAALGLCSAVAVAVIANGGKSSSSPETRKEAGSYEERATAVDQAFEDAEETLAFFVSTAQAAGDQDKAQQLQQTANGIRTTRMQV